MTKIELIRLALTKATEADEITKLNEELIATIREDERAKVAAEAATAKAEEDRKAAIPESKMAKIPEGIPVKVTETDNYKGSNLKKIVGNLQLNVPNEKIRLFSKENPTQAELAGKFMVDLLSRAPRGEINKSLTEGTTTAGGYLTPTEEREAVLAYVREVSICMPDCDIVGMTSDVMTMPKENAKVDVAFTAEETDATETDPSLALVTLTAKRLDGYTKVSNELIADSFDNIAARLVSQFAEAIGQKIDSVVCVGTGDPMSGVFLTAGNSVVFGATSTNFSELLESNLRTAISQIRTSRLTGAKWYAHRTPAWTVLYNLEDDNGRPLFIPSMVAGVPNVFYGFPLKMPELAPSTSAVSTGFIVFGNLIGVMIGERLANVDLFVDPYSLSRSYQTQFLLFTRWAFAQAMNEYYTRIATPAS